MKNALQRGKGIVFRFILSYLEKCYKCQTVNVLRGLTSFHSCHSFPSQTYKPGYSMQREKRALVMTNITTLPRRISEPCGEPVLKRIRQP